MDAIVVRPGLALAAAWLALAIAIPSPTPTLEERALDAAGGYCEARFEVFDTAELGSMRAVFLAGPLTAVVIFRGDDVMIRKFGEHTMERVELVEVAGQPVIVLDESHDHHVYREYFVVEEDQIVSQRRLQLR